MKDIATSCRKGQWVKITFVIPYKSHSSTSRMKPKIAECATSVCKSTNLKLLALHYPALEKPLAVFLTTLRLRAVKGG